MESGSTDEGSSEDDAKEGVGGGGQMIEGLAWVCENGPWLLAGVLVLVVVCVPWWECMRIDESERGREEELDDEQGLA